MKGHESEILLPTELYFVVKNARKRSPPFQVRFKDTNLCDQYLFSMRVDRQFYLTKDIVFCISLMPSSFYREKDPETP